MGSKVKGWHQKGPRGEKKRMSEDNVGRRPKYRSRQERKSHENNRVDYSQYLDHNSDF